MKIGFVGIGQMGLPLCTNLVRAGFDVRVFDAHPAAVESVSGEGATPAESLADLGAWTEVVVTALPSPTVSEAVIAGDDGLLPHLGRDSVIIEMSTVSPSLVRDLASRCLEHGVHFLDCGMSGGPGGARDASLALMVGGDTAVLERVRPVLEAMGSNIVHCGGTGAGMAAKLVNNALAHVNALAICEAFSLGVKSGLDPKVLYDVVRNSSGDSWVLPHRFEQYIKSGEFTPGMKLDLLHKDSTLAMEMAQESNTPLFLLKLANSLFTWYQLEGLGEENWSKMMTVWERQLDIRIGAKAD